jgi:hypothetical protein
MWEDFGAPSRHVLRVCVRHTEQEEEGMSEYDKNGKRRNDDDETPDVEAHKAGKRRGDDGPPPTEMERNWHRHSDDGSDDDSPDVEAHRFKIR